MQPGGGLRIAIAMFRARKARSCFMRLLIAHLGFLRNRPNPLAERRKPDPQIRRNLTPGQVTGERDANRIPLELVAVYHCHIRSP